MAYFISERAAVVRDHDCVTINSVQFDINEKVETQSHKCIKNEPHQKLQKKQ